MYEKISIKSSFGDYDVTFQSWQNSVRQFEKKDNIFIVDRLVADLYPEIHNLHVTKIYVEATEEAKSYASIGMTMKRALELGLCRESKLIGIGGGITQDITSFAASVLMRGVDWVFYPTNLLAQCDSCIGSKTSVNIGSFKNQIGGFFPPCAVFIDRDFRKTLAQKDIFSGLGEMMHYILVDGSTDLGQLPGLIDQARTDPGILDQLIQKSLLIKKKMIEIDEFDRGPRCVFNYGHTFGHAIEACTEYRVPHGIAVAYGMDLANFLSVNLDHVSIEFRNNARVALAKIWFDTPLPAINTSDYVKALKRDKKSSRGIIRPILTKGQGKMFQEQLTLTCDLKKLIHDYFEQEIYSRNI
ncbi:MAG: 3-dehydroquinate synthase [Flavobacteriaceae bacterium]|mgnify:CR=1 FL=1|nr:3-dehydroquinate synthase [Flavobacteriaceae bacterium]|tara:strand:+ start:4761 stop:5828 length:1068 start_codon:yes stop_codon:yes gene_type:complete